MTTTNMNDVMMVNEPSQRRPMTRLWNRGDAIRIAVIFVLTYLVTQIAGGVAVVLGDIDMFWLTVTSLLTSAVAGIGSVLLVNRWRPRHSWAALGFTPMTRRWLVIATVGALALGVLRGGLITWLSQTFPVLNLGVDALADALMFEQPYQIALVIVITSIIVPIWEEIFFRGYIHNVLRNRLGMWSAIIVSSLLFGLFHIVPLQILGAFSLGLLLAWLYDRSGNLWLAIYAHALNNIIFVGLAYITAG